VVGRIEELRGAFRNADVRRLWGSQVASEVGDWSARVAVAVLVFERTGSSALTGLVAALSFAPWVVLGPILSALADRFPRRRVLVATDIARAAVWALLVVPVPVWVVMVAVFVAAALTPPFTAARSSLLPDLAGDDYGAALGVAHMTSQAAQIAGFVAGGGLVAWLGASPCLAVNAASFAVSAAFLVRLRSGTRPADAATSAASRLRDATRFLVRDRVLRRAVLIAGAVQCSGAVVEALIVVYVRDRLHGSATLVGLLSAVVAGGFLVTAAVLPTKREASALLRSAALLAVGGSVVAFAGFLAGLTGPALVLPYAAIGVAFASIVPANAVGGPRVPTEIRGSAMGLLQSVIMGAQAIGAGAGGFAAAAIGVAPACALAMVPALAYAAFALVHPVRSMEVASWRRVPAATSPDIVIDLRAGAPEPELVG
jgi:MFS family permease